MNFIEQSRKQESGNVLFLILIAVALFAALSYAVTQSTRSGSGTTEKETNLLNSATLTQYPTSLRTAVVRMILNGKDIDDIGFDTPASFAGLSDETNGVFHPRGGGAVYQLSPDDVMANNLNAAWHYNGNFEVPEIGQDEEGGNELIAFLPGVSQGICRKLNEELGITVGGAPTYDGIPDFNATTDADIIDDHLEAETFPVGDEEDIDDGNNSFDGEPSGCFYDSSLTSFIFYTVLLER